MGDNHRFCLFFAFYTGESQLCSGPDVNMENKDSFLVKTESKTAG